MIPCLESLVLRGGQEAHRAALRQLNQQQVSKEDLQMVAAGNAVFTFELLVLMQ